METVIVFPFCWHTDQFQNQRVNEKNIPAIQTHQEEKQKIETSSLSLFETLKTFCFDENEMQPRQNKQNKYVHMDSMLLNWNRESQKKKNEE